MPYSNIKWVKRNAKIVSYSGETIWEKEVEVSDHLSEQAVNIIAEKYLKNRKGENYSLRNMIDSVSETIANKGVEFGYFDEAGAERLANNLKWIQINNVAGFNSPVYFNMGQREDVQASACFINGMEDSMESIADLAKRESKIFQNGSGSGVDYSVLRSSKELVRGINTASGPVSFLKVHDAMAGEVKSGGAVRRAARMAVLDVKHPDIVDFINIKSHEEEKIRAIAEAGIKPFIGTRLEDEVYYQNTNLSVRMDKKFLDAVSNNLDWELLSKDGKVIETVKARDLMDIIVQGAWKSAEPGVHFSDNINNWNTVSHKGKIEASNPCSEFMFLNNSACNLAAINLVKLFHNQPINPFGLSRSEIIKEVIHSMIWAQDIICEMASYPNDLIKETSLSARPLGLGFTDLGSYLMLEGLSYDSEAGRVEAGRVMNIISANAHLASTRIANKKGSYKWLDKNSHIPIIKKHLSSASEKGYDTSVWEDVLENVHLVGIRNAQLTLLAPCGTMGFLLDNVTTGIEPIFSHVSYKNLEGGGQMRLLNRYLNEALNNMGYEPSEIIDNRVDLSHVAKIDRDVFATAGEINWEGHIKMMAAIQPFLSGSISKTVNMCSDSTITDIEKCYFMAHKLGLKSVIVYRDGCKAGQVLITEKTTENPKKVSENKQVINRIPLPDERMGGTHKFVIDNDMKGYLTWGIYDDGRLGELFLNIAKEGSTLSGLLDSMATIVSVALQYGVPLETIVEKMIHRRFEPSGMTKNPDIRFTDSLIDYIFKYLGIKFLDKEACDRLGLVKSGEVSSIEKNAGNVCPICGCQLKRLGSCEQCTNCSYNGGSCS